MKPTLGTDVVVVGGGIVGCASAYYLAKRGVAVVLLEQSVIGGEASGRNAGGVRAQCRDRRERHLAIASIQLWERLEQELGFDVEYHQGGNIRLATTEERMAELCLQAEEELADGLAVEVWDRNELRRRASYLSDIFIGAKYCATDGVANPILASKAFGWAAKRAGATVMEHTAATAIELKAGRVSRVYASGPENELVIETPWVIHAAGPWTPHLSHTLEVKLPVKPARVVMGVTQAMPPFFSEFVSSHDLGVYARPARSGHIHIGRQGEREPTLDKRTPPDALADLGRIVEMIPALRNVNLLRTWAGTLAMTPDGIPIIGPAPGIGGYILATGFSGHGFCLGPIVGQLLSELVVDGRPSLPLDDFRLDRFHPV